jgi:DNA polymerase-3 subunit gamma/tau
MAKALYLRWRPSSLDAVVGQEHIITTLRHAIQAGRTAHAYLFSGPRGTGKTTTARLLAKALNCTAAADQRPCNRCRFCQSFNAGHFLDLIEIDAASNTSVDDVRELRDKIGFAPNEGRYKVYIIDEVHMLSNAAFNALLKTLEEPPPHAVFILATTETHKLPATVTSRCQRYVFRSLTVPEIIGRLQEVVTAEQLNVEPTVLELVAHQAQGGMRDALSLLDQLLSDPSQILTAERAREVLGISHDATLTALTEALAQRNIPAGLALLSETLSNGNDPRQFARQVTDHLRNLLLAKLGSAALIEAPNETKARCQTQAGWFEQRALLAALQAFDAAATERRGGWLPQLPLELAFLQAVGATLQPVTALPSTSAGVIPTAAAQPAAAPFVPTAQPPTPALTAPVSTAPTAAKPNPPLPARPVSSEQQLTLAQVQQHWAQIVQRSRAYHHALQALLAWCSPVDLQGDLLLLGCKKEFAMQKLDSPELRAKLLQTCQEVLRTTVHLQFVRHDVATEADIPDVSEGGVVAAAIKLGARVREIPPSS